MMIVAALLLQSCDYFLPQRQPESKLLASVEGKELRLSDVEKNFPQGLNSKDSVEFLKNYVHNWARKCLMAAQAEKHLDDERKNVAQELEEYRMSLLAYRYEMQHLNNELDTLVSEQELMTYHEQNPVSQSVPSIEQLRQQYYNTIINKRRQQLISKLENDVYNEALDNQRLKIYIE